MSDATLEEGDDARRRLEEAHEEFVTVRERVEETGLDDLRRVRSAYENLTRLLDRY
jgi:uncharacterized coiled-coil DUF342 family protein